MTTKTIHPNAYNADDDSPAFDAFEITTSDTAEFDYVVRALYVGVGGDVIVTTVNGNDVTFVGVPAGSILPIRCVRVKIASTASSIVGMY